MARSAASTATKEATPPANASPAPQQEQEKLDFLWTYTEEPHRTRRLAIIKAHPEVTPPRLPPSPIFRSNMLTCFGPGP